MIASFHIHELMITIDSNTARDAFATFIPISIASDARTKIIFDFFDLMAAIAAHGKTNGMGGRKLSRLGGWYAFEQVDTGSGFDGGYKAWARFVATTTMSDELSDHKPVPLMLRVICSSLTFDPCLPTRYKVLMAYQLYPSLSKISLKQPNTHHPSVLYWKVGQQKWS